jgi:hypothetical protein
MSKREQYEKEKGLDVYASMENYGSFKDEYVKWLELELENQAKNNEVLDLVSEMKKPNVHECLNDIMEVVNRRCRLFGEDLGSLRYEFKKAIDKMNCSR